MNMFCAKHCVKGQSNDSVHPTSKAVHFDIASPAPLLRVFQRARPPAARSGVTAGGRPYPLEVTY